MKANLFYFFKFDIQSKDRLIRVDQSYRLIVGLLFKAKVFFTLYELAHQNM
jgi:hypothetical protein